MKRTGEALARLFDERPGAFFVAVLAGQLALWTLLPALFFHNVPLDVTENVGWGREWQWGYYKHPPLQAWLTEILPMMAGGRLWSIYLLSQIAIVLTYIPLFLLGREAAGPKAGLVAVLLFSLVFYANVPTPEFNANVVQMPIWAFAALALWRGATTRKLGWWLGLGLAAALAIYAKYSAVILFAALIAASLAVAECRAAYRTAGPYIAVGVALLLAAPHLSWLIASGFMPIEFAKSRAGEIAGIRRITGPLHFLSAQALDHLGAAIMLIAGGFLAGLRNKAADGVAFTSPPVIRRFVLWMAIAPYAATVLFSLLSGFGLLDMWGAPMPLWISLAVVLLLRPVYRAKGLAPMLFTWACLFVAAPVFVTVAAVFGPALGAPPSRLEYPGDVLARQLTGIWRDATGKPLRIAAGDIWQSGIAVAYSPDRPSVFVRANLRFNPWITPERIAAEGVLVLWGDDTPRPPADCQWLGPFTASGEVSAPFAYAPSHLATLHWAIRPPGGPPPQAPVRSSGTLGR